MPIDYTKHVIKQFINCIHHKPIEFYFIDEDRMVSQYGAKSICSSRYGFVCSFRQNWVDYWVKQIEELGIIEKLYNKFSKVWKQLTDKQSAAIKTVKKWESEDHLGIKGGLLHLTMGTGKTLIALYMASLRRHRFPSLLIVTAPVIKSINEEIKRWYPEMNVLICHNDFGSTWQMYLKPEFFHKIEAYDLVMVSHQTLGAHYKRNKIASVITGDGSFKSFAVNQGRSYLARCNIEHCRHSLFYGNLWDRVFFDESHNIRNPKSLSAAAAVALNAHSYFCMTGTPTVNSNNDVITQMVFLGYDHTKVDKKENYMEKFKHRIYQSPVVEKSTSVKYNFNYFVNLTPKEQQIYTSFLNKINDEYKTFEMLNEGWDRILTILVKLRIASITSHNISMFDNNEMTERNISLYAAGFDQDYVNSEESKNGAKIQALLKLLKIFPKEWKVLVFTEYIEPIKVAADMCNKAGYNAAYIESKMSDGQRKAIFNAFKTNPDFKLLGLNFKTGSTGHNLQCANVVIFLESWWNEATERQAEARCWRKGQTKPVYVIHMTTKDSIEKFVVQVKTDKQQELEQAWNNMTSSSGDTKSAIREHIVSRFERIKSYNKPCEIIDSLEDGERLETNVSNKWVDELKHIEKEFDEGLFNDKAVDTLMKFEYMYMLNKYDLYAYKIFKNLYPEKTYQDFINVIYS